MKPFLLDLWSDLREKRLWPVAVVLLAGLVAVPVVLSKKADEPAAPAPLPAATQSQAEKPEGPAALAQVKLDGSEGGTGSSLSAFDESNPFAPPKKVLEAARREQEGLTGSEEIVVEEPGAGSIDVGIGGGVPSKGDSPSVGDIPAPVAPEQPPTGDGHHTPAETTEYSYVLDVTFWANERRRTVKGMAKLDILPSQGSPLLIFLGVSANAGNAVFLVDSSLTAAGEGNCRPSADDCAYLDLGAGSEHEFTNDQGASYRLRIDEIRKVKVGAKARSSANGEGRTANVAVGAAAPLRRFVPPLLTDLVSVSSGDNDHSNSDGNRR